MVVKTSLPPLPGFRSNIEFASLNAVTPLGLSARREVDSAVGIGAIADKLIVIITEGEHEETWSNRAAVVAAAIGLIGIAGRAVKSRGTP